ncbi:hypothetical protein AAFF_G00225390 [Aldrovandia affinis]|uniref:Uncharacterized protein n=1 Tax=Aldrovandia affinis TaxID=143900 RepID=A0AAD7TCL4_9TELE|nr:hypothetical protein AAFF_G00225390 [Aldrovandia affinis]
MTFLSPVISHLITYFPESGGVDGRLLGNENIDIKMSDVCQESVLYQVEALDELEFSARWDQVASLHHFIDSILEGQQRDMDVLQHYTQWIWKEAVMMTGNKVKLLKEELEKTKQTELSLETRVNDRDLKIEEGEKELLSTQLLNKELEMNSIASAEKLSAEEQQRCVLEDKIKALSCENAQLKGRINIIELEVTTLIQQERTLQE